MQKLSPRHNTSFTRAGRRSGGRSSSPCGRQLPTGEETQPLVSVPQQWGGVFFSTATRARTTRGGEGDRGSDGGEELQHTGVVVAAIQNPRHHLLRRRRHGDGWGEGGQLHSATDPAVGWGGGGVALSTTPQ